MEEAGEDWTSESVGLFGYNKLEVAAGCAEIGLVRWLGNIITGSFCIKKEYGSRSMAVPRCCCWGVVS